MADFKKAGISATFWVLALFFGIVVLFGILAWLRLAVHEQPTNPATPTGSYLRAAPYHPPATQA